MTNHSLQLPEFLKRTSLCCKATWTKTNSNNNHNDPIFPRSIKLNKHAVAWIEREVDTWLGTRIAEHDNQQAKG